MAFLRDESDRWRAISALQESEERFRLVVEGAPDGVAILNGPRIRFLNPRAARMLGVAASEAAEGRAITDFIHPDDVPACVARIRQLLETGVAHREAAEYRSRSLDGEELVVEISAIPIEIGGERTVLAFARDVTERKAIQRRLAEAERLTALGVLSAGVAHEINNPLAYVLLNLEYLRRELPRLATQPERLEDLMIRVRDACHGAERVATIVRDLRTFARGDDSARGPVDLREVLEAAVNIAGNTLSQRARIVRDYGDSPAVEGNANRLEQVFLNLLLNAAQAMPNGDPSKDENPRAHSSSGRPRQRRDRGHRRRHPRRDYLAHFRAIFLDQAGRCGHGPGLAHLPQHHRQPQRQHRRGERRGPGREVPRRFAGSAPHGRVRKREERALAVQRGATRARADRRRRDRRWQHAAARAAG
ncbi:MAG: PAS domain S-box protein [Polyangiaceae bacterium]